MATLKNTIINDTGYLRLPNGTTAQCPGSPVAGMMRFNNTSNRTEYYNGEYWYTPYDLLADNVHPNPTDIFAWSGTISSYSCIISRDNISSPFYNTPLKMEITGFDPYTETWNSASWNIASATNGQTWEVSVWVKASVVMTNAQIFIFGADSNNNIIEIGSGSINVDITWSKVSYSFTFSNPNVAFIQTRLDGPNSGASGQTLWWDGLQVRRIS